MPVIPSPYSNYSVKLSGSVIAKSALRKISSLASDEIEAEDLAICLECLNDMMDTWNSEELTIPSITSHEFQLVSGTQSYTIGPGAVFDMPRPPKIIDGQCTVKIGNLEYPLRVLSREEWGTVRIKSLPTTIPYAIFYDQDSPLGNISFYPIPGATSFIFYAPNLLSQITNSSDVFYLPPAYSEALKFGLAVRVASEFNKVAPPDVMEIAAVSKANLKRMNYQPDSLKCEPTMMNWPAGWIDPSAFARGF